MTNFKNFSFFSEKMRKLSTESFISCAILLSTGTVRLTLLYISNFTEVFLQRNFFWDRIRSSLPIPCSKYQQRHIHQAHW